MSTENKKLAKANISLLIVVIVYIAGVVFFRAQEPVNAPEGMSMSVAMSLLFWWYTLIVILCLVSVFYRLKYVATISGFSKYLNIVLAVMTLAPFFLYIFVIYENII